MENGGGQVIYNSTVPRLAFRNSTSGTTALDGTDLAQVSSDFYVFNREAGAIIFGTSGLDRMRITSGGNVLIGTTTDNGAKLQVSGTSTFTGNTNGEFAINSTNSNSGSDAATLINLTNNSSVAQFVYTSSTYSGAYDFGANSLAFINRASGSINFVTAGFNSSALRMRITSGGNVGIGTPSPNSKLHVAGDFRTVLTSGVGGDTLIAAINGVSNGYIINVDTSNNITHTWNTGANAAALRITPSGNVLIGTTTDSGYTLNVAGNAQFIKSSTSTAMVVGLSGVTGSIIRFSYNAGFVGSISTDGTNTAYNTSSDYRLKEQVRPIDNPLEKVMKLNPVNFKYKNSKTVQDGFIAHEIQEILPYLVTGEKDGVEMQEVDYSKLTPILIAAIKEQQAQIQELKNKLS